MGQLRCVLPNCHRRLKDFGKHKLPKDEHFRQFWIDAIKEHFPRIRELRHKDCICSMHFRESETFVSRKKTTCVQKYSVPSVFLTNPDLPEWMYFKAVKAGFKFTTAESETSDMPISNQEEGVEEYNHEDHNYAMACSPRLSGTPDNDCTTLPPSLILHDCDYVMEGSPRLSATSDIDGLVCKRCGVKCPCKDQDIQIPTFSPDPEHATRRTRKRSAPTDESSEERNVQDSILNSKLNTIFETFLDLNDSDYIQCPGSPSPTRRQRFDKSTGYLRFTTDELKQSKLWEKKVFAVPGDFILKCFDRCRKCCRKVEAILARADGNAAKVKTICKKCKDIQEYELQEMVGNF